MSALLIPVAALLGIFLLNILKRYAPVFAVAAQIALTILIVVNVFASFKEILSAAYGIFYETGVSETGFKVMLKVFGLLLTGGIVADVCRDSGESALAGAVELFVRGLSLVSVLPTFSAVVKIALGFFSGE